MKLNKKQMFYTLVFIILIMWSVIYLGIEFVIGVFGHFILFGLLIYILSFIVYFLFTKRKLNFLRYLDKFALGYSIFLLIFFLGIYGFVKYNNDINPAKVGIYELYNKQEDKTIRYISMSHIARENFYKQVKEELQKANDEGFVLFFEGVRLGTEANMQKFYNIMGVKINNDFYSNLSKVYGLESQNNDELINIFGKNFYNIDLSVDDIIEEYEKLPEEIKTKASRLGDIETNFTKDISNEIENLLPKQKEIIKIIGKSIINFVFKMVEENPNIGGKGSVINELILVRRNELLADSINNSNHKKIIILYGGLHYKGVVKLLQEKSNNAWEEKTIKYLFPITIKK